MSDNEAVSLDKYLDSKATPEIRAVVMAACKGVVLIADAMRNSESLLGYSNSRNVQGETQADLDIFADKAMSEAFFGSGVVAALVSEEQPELVLGGRDRAPLVVAHDPLDGSSNIPFNIPVGSIFSVFKRRDPSAPPSSADYFQPGSSVVCAGYAVYGLRTQFVVSWGQGVVDAVWDPQVGAFMVRNRELKSRTDGGIFSVNEGNSKSWSPGISRFIAELKEEGGFSGRYVGSLVSDFDRNLRKGGIYLYPGDAKNPRGKLRFLYECLPLAFIAEQAGARSYDGQRSILEVTASGIHERCPLFIGSSSLVERLIRHSRGE